MKFGEERLLTALRSIRWDDMSSVIEIVPPLLEELAESPEWIEDALANLVTDEHLRTLTERLAELDKLVLLVDQESGARVRMHVYRQGYLDRPHNHRFTFATHILTGSYMHTVYGDYPDVSVDSDVDSFKPKLVKREVTGTGYCIEHTIVHSVAAEPDTVTLTVRGPAQKDRMLIVDSSEGRCWWVFGMKDESPEEVRQRRLGTERIFEIRDLLRGRSVI